MILVSGYHDSSDVWTQSDVLNLTVAAKGPPVFESLAGHHHVCAYDRPGTERYIEAAPLTDRTTPVRQPRTARPVVDEPEALLDAADVPKPYVLVGHSLGGLIVQLYARLLNPPVDQMPMSAMRSQSDLVVEATELMLSR